MTGFHAGLERSVGRTREETRARREERVGRDGRSSHRFARAMLLSGAGVLVLGCQAGPVIPLGFGPPLDDMLGFLIFAVVGALLFRHLAPWFRGRVRRGADGTAEVIARERYARGEISGEEYERLIRTLSAR